MSNNKIPKSEEEWREHLTPEEYTILREKGTEAPFSGKYVNTDTEGVYRCKACGNELFSSNDKYKSGTGWPSFTDVVKEGSVVLQHDPMHGMERTEVVCAQCKSHLGHLFRDGPEDADGRRFCINSKALSLKENEDEDQE